jgi:hypothetical protein
MRRTSIRKKQKLEKGDFIFLKGSQVIAKWEVMEVVDGITHLKIVGENHKTFAYKGDEYYISRPLWTRGLPAFPYSETLQRDWKAFQSRKDMLDMMKELYRIQIRMNKLVSSKKILSCMDILSKSIKDLKQALRNGGEGENSK